MTIYTARVNRHVVPRHYRAESDGSHFVQVLLTAFLVAVVLCAAIQLVDLMRGEWGRIVEAMRP